MPFADSLAARSVAKRQIHVRRRHRQDGDQGDVTRISPRPQSLQWHRPGADHGAAHAVGGAHAVRVQEVASERSSMPAQSSLLASTATRRKTWAGEIHHARRDNRMANAGELAVGDSSWSLSVARDGASVHHAVPGAWWHGQQLRRRRWGLRLQASKSTVPPFMEKSKSLQIPRPTL